MKCYGYNNNSRFPLSKTSSFGPESVNICMFSYQNKTNSLVNDYRVFITMLVVYEKCDENNNARTTTLSKLNSLNG